MHCLIKKNIPYRADYPLHFERIHLWLYGGGGGFQVLFLKIFETHIMLKVNK